jgi:hypothetical protein
MADRRKRLTPHTKLTEAVAEAYLRELATAPSPRAAAALSGTIQIVVDRWLLLGERGDQPYADLLMRVEMVRADREASLLETLQSTEKHAEVRKVEIQLQAWNPGFWRPQYKGSKVELPLEPDQPEDKAMTISVGEAAGVYALLGGGVGDAQPSGAGVNRSQPGASPEEIRAARAAAEAVHLHSSDE